MSHRIISRVSYSCSNCGHETDLGENEIYLEAASNSERGMGEEAQYTAYIDLPCDNCNENIVVNIEVWEYPVGVINHTDCQVNGAELLNSSFEISHHRPSPRNEDGSRVLGAAAGGAIFGASVGGPFGAIIGGVIGGLIGDSVKNGGKNNG